MAEGNSGDLPHHVNMKRQKIKKRGQLRDQRGERKTCEKAQNGRGSLSSRGKCKKETPQKKKEKKTPWEKESKKSNKGGEQRDYILLSNFMEGGRLPSPLARELTLFDETL